VLKVIGCNVREPFVRHRQHGDIACARDHVILHNDIMVRAYSISMSRAWALIELNGNTVARVTFLAALCSGWRSWNAVIFKSTNRKSMGRLLGRSRYGQKHHVADSGLAVGLHWVLVKARARGGEAIINNPFHDPLCQLPSSPLTFHRRSPTCVCFQRSAVNLIKNVTNQERT